MNKTFTNILHKLGDPPIKLLSPKEYENSECKHTKLLNQYGKSCIVCKSITVNEKLNKNILLVTLYEEVLHILFKSKPHYWIELVAVKLSGRRAFCKWAKKYNKLEVKIESKAKILKLAIKASERMKRNQTTK
jgi:hypothetical protein